MTAPPTHSPPTMPLSTTISTQWKLPTDRVLESIAVWHLRHHPRDHPRHHRPRLRPSHRRPRHRRTRLRHQPRQLVHRRLWCQLSPPKHAFVATPIRPRHRHHRRYHRLVYHPCPHHACRRLRRRHRPARHHNGHPFRQRATSVSTDVALGPTWVARYGS